MNIEMQIAGSQRQACRPSNKRPLNRGEDYAGPNGYGWFQMGFFSVKLPRFC